MLATFPLQKAVRKHSLWKISPNAKLSRLIKAWEVCLGHSNNFNIYKLIPKGPISLPMAA